MWQAFQDEISRWRDTGECVEFWWRDDDASRKSAKLIRLLDLAASTEVPLALAIVPQSAERLLIEHTVSGIAAIQHGVDHRNRAGASEKKSEFPALEPPLEALQRLLAGRGRLDTVVGERALPVLAPPWNRLNADLIPRLAPAGYRGLSTYGARKSREPAPGLLQVNTHVDLIDWKRGACFGGAQFVLSQAIRHLADRREGRVDPTEPTGWLTHHAVHDEDAWHFLEELFAATHRAPGVTWVHPRELFGFRQEPGNASHQ